MSDDSQIKKEIISKILTFNPILLSKVGVTNSAMRMRPKLSSLILPSSSDVFLMEGSLILWSVNYSRPPIIRLKKKENNALDFFPNGWTWEITKMKKGKVYTDNLTLTLPTPDSFFNKEIRLTLERFFLKVSLDKFCSILKISKEDFCD